MPDVIAANVETTVLRMSIKIFHISKAQCISVNGL